MTLMLRNTFLKQALIFFEGNQLWFISLWDLMKEAILRELELDKKKASTARDLNPQPHEFLLLRQVFYRCASTTAPREPYTKRP